MLLYRHCNYSLFFTYLLFYNCTQLPMGNQHSSCKHLIRFIVLITPFIFMFSSVVDWKLSLMLAIWLSGYWFRFYVFYKWNFALVFVLTINWILLPPFKIVWQGRARKNSPWYRGYFVEGLSVWIKNLKYRIVKRSFVIRSTYTKQQKPSKALTCGNPRGNLF